LTKPVFVFPGCLIPARLPFIEASSRLVLDRLDVDHAPLPGATCCVEPIGLRTMAHDTWLASAARLLSIAEEEGRDILTLCNGCYMSLQEARRRLQDAVLRKKVNGILREIGREYRGEVRVHHLAGFIHQLGEEKVRSVVTAPINLLVAAHPGCHMLRPSEVLRMDQSFRPEMLIEVTSWTGARVVRPDDWPQCCGGGVAGVDAKLSNDMLSDVIHSFSDWNAQAILTPCPFCFIQFDLKQKEFPVLHLSELLALSMGASPERIGLRYHRNKLVLNI